MSKEFLDFQEGLQIKEIQRLSTAEGTSSDDLNCRRKSSISDMTWLNKKNSGKHLAWNCVRCNYHLNDDLFFCSPIVRAAHRVNTEEAM